MVERQITVLYWSGESLRQRERQEVRDYSWGWVDVACVNFSLSLFLSFSRSLFSLSLYFSLSLPPCSPPLSLFLSVSLSVFSLSLSLSLFPPSLSMSLCLYLSVFSFSLSLSLCLSYVRAWGANLLAKLLFNYVSLVLWPPLRMDYECHRHVPSLI